MADGPKLDGVPMVKFDWLERIEDAIGGLAVLVGRHSAIPSKSFVAVEAMRDEFVERENARKLEAAARLQELDAERERLVG